MDTDPRFLATSLRRPSNSARISIEDVWYFLTERMGVLCIHAGCVDQD